MLAKARKYCVFEFKFCLKETACLRRLMTSQLKLMQIIAGLFGLTPLIQCHACLEIAEPGLNICWGFNANADKGFTVRVTVFWAKPAAPPDKLNSNADGAAATARL